MNVLVVNAGSSSLKYQLLNTKTEEVIAKGLCECIGTEGNIKHTVTGKPDIKKDIPMPNHSVATSIVVEMLTNPETGCIKDMSEIEAVGHRIVHGGSYFKEHCIINDDVINKLNLCIDLAPLHTKAHLMGIKGCLEVMPNTPQCVIFDTVFHQTMPDYAYFYPIPYDLYKKYQIRRYGFHGTSHKYVSSKMCEILGRVDDTKIITCHLGNGSSISAVKDGKVIDTSMGFTPLDGLEMGTRCGSIDPAIVTFIMEKENLSPSEMNDFMNKKCGFLGVSGISNDSRDIESTIDKNEGGENYDRAKLTAGILTYQIKKYIGAYTAAMGGLDAVVFTAGIGENNPQLRERVCKDMEYFGIDIDYPLNAKMLRQPNIVELSTPKSKVKVYIIPTNEEYVIAYETDRLLSAAK